MVDPRAQITEKVWAGLAERATSHLVGGVEKHTAGEIKAAAAHFEVAGTILRIGATHALGYARHALMGAEVDLKDLSRGLTDRDVPVAGIDAVVARTYLAVSEHYAELAAEALDRRCYMAGGTHLEAAAISLERAHSRSPVVPNPSSAKNFEATRLAGRRLVERGADGDVGTALTALVTLAQVARRLEDALAAGRHRPPTVPNCHPGKRT